VLIREGSRFRVVKMFIFWLSQQIALTFGLLLFASPGKIFGSLFEKAATFISIVKIPMNSFAKYVLFTLKGLDVVFSRLLLFFQLNLVFLYLFHLTVHNRIAVFIAFMRNGRTCLCQFCYIFLFSPSRRLIWGRRISKKTAWKWSYLYEAGPGELEAGWWKRVRADLNTPICWLER
jgi:hypothetical protein